MAINFLRLQLECRIGPAGFSEDYYIAGNSPIGARATADAIARKRADAMVSVSQVHHVRITSPQPGTRSYRFVPTNGRGALTALRDAAGATITVGAYTLLGNLRTLKFHACQDSQITYDAAGDPVVTIPPAIQTFLNYIGGSSPTTQTHIRTLVSRANAATKNVAKFVYTGGKFVATTALAVPAVGLKLQMRSAKGYKTKRLNRIWTVADQTGAAAGTINLTTAASVPTDFLYVEGSASIILADPATRYSYDPITSYDLTAQFSGKKTGRPTDSPRGRS